MYMILKTVLDVVVLLCRMRILSLEKQIRELGLSPEPEPEPEVESKTEPEPVSPVMGEIRDIVGEIGDMLKMLNETFSNDPEPELKTEAEDPQMPQKIKAVIRICTATHAQGFRFVRVARDKNLDVDYDIDQEGMHITMSVEGANVDKIKKITEEIAQQVEKELTDDDFDYEI